MGKTKYFCLKLKAGCISFSQPIICSSEVLTKAQQAPSPTKSDAYFSSTQTVLIAAKDNHLAIHDPNSARLSRIISDRLNKPHDKANYFKSSLLGWISLKRQYHGQLRFTV